MGRDSIQEEQLIHRDAESAAELGVDARHRALTHSLDDVIDPQQPTQRSEDDRMQQRSITVGTPCPRPFE